MRSKKVDFIGVCENPVSCKNILGISHETRTLYFAFFKETADL